MPQKKTLNRRRDRDRSAREIQVEHLKSDKRFVGVRARNSKTKKKIDYYRSVLDVLWEHLGEQRLVFGSNWPCTKNSGDYDSFVRLVNEYFSAKGQEACERYFWKNASEAYHLDLE